MTAMSSKFNFECVIQYHTDQSYKSNLQNSNYTLSRQANLTESGLSFIRQDLKTRKIKTDTQVIGMQVRELGHRDIPRAHSKEA